VEIVEAQPFVGDMVQRWRRNQATKGARHSEAGVIGNDQK
jgi:hypothetical protein